MRTTQVPHDLQLSNTDIAVLIADPDTATAEALKEQITERLPDATVDVASSWNEAEDAVAECDGYDCIVSEYRLGEKTGFDLLSLARENWPSIPFILFTTEQSNEMMNRALREGVLSHVPKDDGERLDALSFYVVQAINSYWKRLSSYLLKNVADALGEAVAVVNQNGEFVYVNQQFAEMTGYTQQQLYRASPRQIVSEDYDEAFYTDIFETLQEQGIWQGDTLNRRPNGDEYLVRQTIVPVRDSEGQIQMYLAVARSIDDSEFKDANRNKT